MTKEEAIKKINEVIFQFESSLDEVDVDEACAEAEEDNRQIVNALNMAIKALEQQPCKGEWIRHTRVENVYDIKGIKTWGIKHQCNKCSFTTIAIEDFGYYDFCPHCGADMRGET